MKSVEYSRDSGNLATEQYSLQLRLQISHFYKINLLKYSLEASKEHLNTRILGESKTVYFNVSQSVQPVVPYLCDWQRYVNEDINNDMLPF